MIDDEARKQEENERKVLLEIHSWIGLPGKSLRKAMAETHLMFDLLWGSISELVPGFSFGATTNGLASYLKKEQEAIAGEVFADEDVGPD